MPRHSPAIDATLRALGDPTRRAIVEHLCDGPASVSELAAKHDMALPSFVQHLGILEDSGLVTSAKKGRVRTYKISTKTLKAVEAWMSGQRLRTERPGARAERPSRKP
jgi:DNA-binding transcriptional ArsR family regulator